MREPETEPPIATSLDDIGELIIYEPIERPDGTVIRVPLRTLTSEQLWQARQGTKWPEAPIQDYKQIGANKGVPIYNFQDDGYRKAIDEANRQQALTIMVKCIVLPIEGSTDSEKIETLKNKLGQYAFDKLLRAISGINHLTEEAVLARARSFRRGRTASSSGNGAAQFDPQPMALTDGE